MESVPAKVAILVISAISVQVDISKKKVEDALVMLLLYYYGRRASEASEASEETTLYFGANYPPLTISYSYVRFVLLTSQIPESKKVATFFCAHFTDSRVQKVATFCCLLHIY